MDIIEKMHLNLEEYEHIQIRTVREFNNLAASINDSSEPKDTKKVYVTLENDIDFDGAGVQWIEKFEGIFNGQNFKIKNFVLSFPSKSFIGLFKKLDGAIVANLTFQDGTMNLGYSSGVFCRDASNSILFNCHVVNVELNKTNSSSCSSSALFVQSGDASFFCQCSVRGSSIKSDDSASGFIHSMNKGCMFIDCCTVDSSITSTTRDDDTYVSGFFGSSQYSKSNCDFINCYASASITTFSKDEGSRTSAFCLNPGEYSAINCYYDSETSGISHETTAAALTSEDILTHYQTALVGFDFENVWKIDETSGYPIPAGVIPEVVDMARDSGPIEEVSTQVTFIKNAAQCLAYINHPSFNTGLSSDGNWGYENGEYFLKHFAKSLGKSSFDVDFNLEEEKEISFYLEAYLESLSEKVTVSISNSDGVVVSRYYNGSHFTKFIHRLEPGDYRLTITFESTSDLSKDEYISLYHFENITIETTKGYFEYKIDDEGEWKKSLIPFIGAVPEGTHQIRSRFVSGDNISQEDCQSYDFQPIEYAGGDGTEGNPYLISKPQHLKLLEEQINNLQLETKDKFYKLTNDIDLSIYENWLPIGYLPSPSTNSGASGNYFRGTFDGNNHTIHNLTINRPLDSGLGLFGTMEDFCILGNHAVNPVIKNVKLRNVNIIGKDCVGSLVGYTYFYREYDKNGPSRLTINNCHVRKAKIIAGEKAGGFIGYSNYAISCSGSSAYNIEMDYNLAVGDSASRQGVSYCGGIIGYLNSSGVQVGRFDDCHVSKFTIKNGNYYLGGFVGMFYNAYACDCSAESVIEVIDGSGGNVGGFSGYSYASSYRDEDDDFIPRFERCDCKILMKPANPTAYISNIGGFTGYSSTFTFSKCRVIADVHGSGSTGGFVGYMSTYGDTPSLTDLLISCRITNPRENSSDVAPICGISASDDTKVSATRVYYDSEVCDAPARTIGTPLTTTQMMGQAATENTALDFASDWQVIDGDYPKLSTIIENSPFENINVPNGWVAVGERQLQTAQKEIVDFVNEGFETVDSRLNEVESKLNSDSSPLDLGIICEPETPFDPIDYLPIPRTEHIGPDKEYRYWIFLTGGFTDTLYITNKKVIYDQSSQKLKMKTEESFGYYKYEDNVSCWDFCENESSTLSISADRLDVVESNYDVKNQDGVILHHANKGLGSNYDHRVLSVAKGTSAALEGYCGKPGELAFNTETKGLHLLGGFVPGGEQVALMSDLFDEVKEIKLKDKKLEPSTVIVHDGSIRFEPTGELHVVANELKEAIVYDESMPLIDYYGKFTWEISFSESFLQNQSKIYLLKSNEESPTKFEAYITVTAEGTEQFVVVVDEEETVEEMVSYGEKYLKANERIKLEIEVKECSSHSATDSVTLCVDNYPVVSSVVNGKAEGSKHRLSLGVPDGVELTVYGVKVDAQKTCVGQTYRKSEIDQLINELKSFVSDGKRLIASAITDKGIEASESDSFQVIAEKIASINSSDSTIDMW